MNGILIVNFKGYESSVGEKALELARVHEKVASEYKGQVMVSVQNSDIFRLSGLGIPILGQHADPVGFGACTGSQLPEALRANGAWGVVLNHSEKRFQAIEDLAKAISRCKEAGLKVVACTESTEEGKRIAEMGPDYLAFEDPELIGSGVSISKKRPDSVKDFAEAICRTECVPLCGAGVSNGEDYSAALKLGTKGVLLASAVTKAEDPESKLREILGLA